MSNLKSIIRYDMVVNGNPEMLSNPEGSFVKFDDIKELLKPTANNGYITALKWFEESLKKYDEAVPLSVIYDWIEEQRLNFRNENFT